MCGEVQRHIPSEIHVFDLLGTHPDKCVGPHLAVSIDRPLDGIRPPEVLGGLAVKRLNVIREQHLNTPPVTRQTSTRVTPFAAVPPGKVPTLLDQMHSPKSRFTLFGYIQHIVSFPSSERRAEAEPNNAHVKVELWYREDLNTLHSKTP